MTPLVSVVIVTFQSRREVAACLGHLQAVEVPLEVIVVDNDSSDGTQIEVEQELRGFAQGVFVRNRENVGFAVAVNQGIAGSKGDFVLLLNPDCYVDAHAIPAALDALEAHPDAGMAGCLLLNPDGTEQSGARRYIPTPWRALMRVLKMDRLFPRVRRLSGFVMKEEPLPGDVIPVEAISGAFMMVRREALAHVGVLDEGYFMHCEDLDWCMRFKQAGWKVLFVPSARAVHDRGRSSASRPIRVEWHKHRGMVRFYGKFFRRRYSSLLMGAVVVAVWTRFGLKVAWISAERVGKALVGRP
jgi:hypothetical protein